MITMSEVQKPSYYSILHVNVDASSSEVVKAYRAMALKYHPDRNPDAETEKFQTITEAYEVLSDPEKRQLYDQYGPSLKPKLSETFAQLTPLLLSFATGFVGSSAHIYSPSLSTRAVFGWEVCLMGVAGMFYCYYPGTKDSTKPQTRPKQDVVSVSDYVTITSMGLLMGNFSGWAATSIVLLCKAIMFGR